MKNRDPEAVAQARSGQPEPEPSAGAVATLKARRDERLAVCLPALNEEATIGTICSFIRTELIEETPLVDELFVIDSGSDDATVETARAAGATVYSAAEILPEEGAPEPLEGGKGETLWKSLAATAADIIVWLDSDTRNFAARFVTQLVAPLLEDDSIVFTKGFYRRPAVDGTGYSSNGSGRVTEIMARPLLNAFFPQVESIVQPLSGECAGRREVLSSIPFLTGYAVEIGLLIDIVDRYGIDAVRQVDLGERLHRNHPLLPLGRAATQVLQGVLLRLEKQDRIKLADPRAIDLVQYVFRENGPVPETWRIQVEERPPMAEVLKKRRA